MQLQVKVLHVKFFLSKPKIAIESTCMYEDIY